MVVEHEGCCVQPLGDHADFVWDGQSQRRYRCPQKHRARLDHRLQVLGVDVHRYELASDLDLDYNQDLLDAALEVSLPGGRFITAAATAA